MREGFTVTAMLLFMCGAVAVDHGGSIQQALQFNLASISCAILAVAWRKP